MIFKNYYLCGAMSSRAKERLAKFNESLAEIDRQRSSKEYTESEIEEIYHKAGMQKPNNDGLLKRALLLLLCGFSSS